MDKPLHELSIAEAGVKLRAGSLTSRALTLHALKRIETIDPQINAFITVTRERALADADARVRPERALIHGPRHPTDPHPQRVGGKVGRSSTHDEEVGVATEPRDVEHHAMGRRDAWRSRDLCDRALGKSSDAGAGRGTRIGQAHRVPQV